MDWIDLAQDRERWPAFVNAIKKTLGFHKREEILDYLRTGSLHKKDSAP